LNGLRLLGYFVRMLILGVETSCDETSASVVSGDGRILSNVVSSQIELHKPYGGVVPEIASRNHLQLIEAVVADALAGARLEAQQLDGVAATYGPGLASSLLVGLTAAKGLAFALGVPFVGINHLEAHLFSPFLTETGWQARQPFVSLIVSGGHTILAFVRDEEDYEVLGATVDDAAGEAFDKVAKLLGLGYPGGPEIDRLARRGNPCAVDFPRSMLGDAGYDFSFSGIKTAVRYLVQGARASRAGRRQVEGEAPEVEPGAIPADQAFQTENRVGQTRRHPSLADLCASFQEAVVDVLVAKTLRAAREKNTRCIAVSGGVACNSRLREKLAAACADNRLALRIAPPQLCTDNAAMIAALGARKLQRQRRSDFCLDAAPSLALGRRL
jgi:N6-L-threonylcarbamoyladenine synthase